MVVFTCNNCGDSVNKPKVDKHIQYECKRKHFAVSFCCVDCLKDFNQETVKDHCQCVTEEQRYSAKGFVPKASAEKGKRKQAGWVDIVQSLINCKNLSNDERQFLNTIAKYDNVPRKKNKFQNFCFSSAPYYRQKGYLVDKVFDMIEAEYKAQQVQNANETPTNNKNIQNTNNTDSIQKESQDEKKQEKNVGNDEPIKNNNDGVEEIPKKKKKKSKQSLDAVENDIEMKSEENIEPQSEKKKKKKEKKSLENSIVKDNLAIANENIDDVKSHADSVKKSKEKDIEVDSEIIVPQSEKKKKKKEKKSLENNAITSEDNSTLKEINTSVIQPNTDTKSKKKKKNSQLEVSSSFNEHVSKTENISKENGLTNGENEILNGKAESQLSKKEKKEMKKKLKYEHELASVTNGVIEADREPISKKKKRKLDNNEENEEPQQKISKSEGEPQVPEVQSGRKFEWNEAINQVLLSKKSKPMSLSKVMKRVMNEYHFLNETTKKTENELEKIFLKKLKKMKNVTIDNDKVQLIEC